MQRNPRILSLPPRKFLRSSASDAKQNTVQCDGTWNSVDAEAPKYHVLEFEETFSDLLKSLQYATQCDGISWNVRPSKFSSSPQAPVPHFHNLQCLGLSNIGTWRMEMYVGSFSECTTWFPSTHMICLCRKCFPCPTRTIGGHRRRWARRRWKGEGGRRRGVESSSPSHSGLTR